MSESESRDLNLTERMIPMKGGKQYLPVADRIVWFRDEYPEGTIETKLVELDREQQFCMYHARVTTGKGGVAEASGTETARDFGDYIEKAETKAVGRALGYLGYGTASAGFEEGQRIVDAPQAPRRDQPPANRPAPPARTTPPAAQPVAADGPVAQPLPTVLEKLRQLEKDKATWPSMKVYADAQWDLADPEGQEAINAEMKAIAARRRGGVALVAPASNAG